MNKNKSTTQLKMEKNKENILSFFNEKVEFYKIRELRKIYNECIDKKYIYSVTTFTAYLPITYILKISLCYRCFVQAYLPMQVSL